jgi:hypothetical protein
MRTRRTLQDKRWRRTRLLPLPDEPNYEQPCRPLNQSALRKPHYKVMDALTIERVKGKPGHHIFRHSAGALLYAKSRDLKLVQGTFETR